jgi:drug/metabolite transporter (DMT)-like permease
VLLSIVLFGEAPGPFQGVGILLALSAILLLTLSLGPGPERLTGGHAYWLVGLFVMGGGPFSTLKVFSELGAPEEKQALLTCIFLFAGVLCWALILAGRVPLRADELTSGAMFGVCNVMSNLSLLYALQTVPGMLAFPIFHAGILLLAGLLGVAVWKERPGALGFGALGISLVALVLMNV